MQTRNYTPFPSQSFISTAKNGEQFYTVVSRATFAIVPDQPLRPHPEQQPLVMADEFYGEMNCSSLKVESDLSPVKPGTDVYFINPVAHAPGGKPAPAWLVRVKVGPLEKSLRVTGPRAWEYSRLFGWRLTEPQPVLTVPIRYELAFGGCWKNGERAAGFDRNYVGRGFVNLDLVDRSKPIPAPQLEDPAEPVKELGKPVAPAGLGPLTRTWQPRLKKAGTYDETWLKTRWPVPPADFDAGFYNCAPPGLVAEKPLRGSEAVELTNLTPRGILRFTLPGLKTLLFVRMQSGEMYPCEPLLDTVTFDLETMLAGLVWRGYVPVNPPVRVCEIRLIHLRAEAPSRRSGHG